MSFENMLHITTRNGHIKVLAKRSQVACLRIQAADRSAESRCSVGCTTITTGRWPDGFLTPTGWAQFLRTNIASIFAMDCFTVDTILGQRYYVHFVIRHATREIVQWAITTNPTHEFVRQQLIRLEDTVQQTIFVIHDRAGEFRQRYGDFGIIGVVTAVHAPNMNAIAERFVRSVRQEALDYYIIGDEFQIRNIIREYIVYYNTQRPHQGINQSIPRGIPPEIGSGPVGRVPVLGGLHHHYYLKVA